MDWSDGDAPRVEDLVGEDTAHAAAVIGATVEVHYQPQVHPVTGSVLGAEALVRARRPDGSFANNASWLPVLEQMGQTGPIDRHVGRTALGVLARLRPVNPRMTMSVNLSPARSNVRYAAMMIELLGEFGLPGNAVIVEITETAAVGDLRLLAATTSALTEAGVRVALDDFGTGWSSLVLLQQLALDELKLDQSLISELRAGSRPARAVARGVLTMAQELGLDVVAEGLEDQEHAAACSHWAFDRYQGWGFGRPTGPEALHKRLVAPVAVVPARATWGVGGRDEGVLVTPKIGVVTPTGG